MMKTLQAEGPEAIVVALYLLTGPYTNMIGLYRLPVSSIVHDTGLSQNDVQRALTVFRKLEFAYHDDETDYVWVVQAASTQVGQDLEERDLRVKHVQRLLDEVPTDCPLRQQFCARYGEAFHVEAVD